MGPWGENMPLRPEQVVPLPYEYQRPDCDCPECGCAWECNCDCSGCDCRFAERQGS